VTTDKPQLSVALPKEDYQWLQEEASIAGISKGGVLRQALSLYRATGGLLGPWRMEMAEQKYTKTQRAESSDNSTE